MNADVIIIGAGAAGLGCGALLSQKGLKVVLFEKEPYTGGRAISVNYKGYILDKGFHLLTLGEASPCAELLQRVGRRLVLAESYTDGVQIWRKGGWQDITEFRKQSPESNRAFKKVIQDILSMSQDEVEALDHVSLKSWLEETTQDQAVLELLGLAGFWFGVNDPSDMAASEIIHEIKRNLEKNHAMGIGCEPEGGYVNIIRPLIDVIQESGGQIFTCKKVNQIVIEKNVARGAMVEKADAEFPSELMDIKIPEGDFFKAPVIICTVPLRQIPGILPWQELPSWFRDRINFLKNQAGLGGLMVAMGIRRMVSKSRKYFVAINTPRERLIFEALFMSNIDPSTAPEGKQLFLTGCFGDIQDIWENGRVRPGLLGEVLDTTSQFFPEVMQEKEWSIDTAIQGLMPVIAKPGLVGRHKIQSVCPNIKGLFFAGDGYEGRGVGINHAMDSAMNCVQSVLDFLKIERIKMVTSKNWFQKDPE